MAVFRRLIYGIGDKQYVEKINNKLNFENRIVPDFWHDFVYYEELLKENNIIFMFNLRTEDVYCDMYYKSTIYDIYVSRVDEEDYLTYLQMFCKHNIIDKHIHGISREIFNNRGVQYVKNIKILIDYDNFINSIEKIIKENPDYNFTKFNNNDDIKIAIKD